MSSGSREGKAVGALLIDGHDWGGATQKALCEGARAGNRFASSRPDLPKEQAAKSVTGVGNVFADNCQVRAGTDLR